MRMLLILILLAGGATYAVWRLHRSRVEAERRRLRQQRHIEQERAWEDMLARKAESEPPAGD